VKSFGHEERERLGKNADLDSFEAGNTIAKTHILIVCINNFQKLMFHLNASKNNSMQYFPEEILKETLNKCYADVIGQISSHIDFLFDLMVSTLFEIINSKLIVKLFK